MRKGLLLGGGVVVLSCVITLSIASQRIDAEQSAYSAPSSGGQCTPSSLGTSAVLHGTPLAVSPLPGAYDASPSTQISLLGAPVSAIGTIGVSGSSTGAHTGKLIAYSQGDGASFVPSKPFAPGERVSVRGSVLTGGKRVKFSYDFVVAHPDTHLFKGTPSKAQTNSSLVQSFHSAPSITPPKVSVDSHSSEASKGDIFLNPYNGPGPSGPMIFDEEGNLVWFDPLPHETYSTNLQVQQYGPERVLTWWQGHIPPQGFGEGEEIIDNSNYQRIGVVHAGNGYTADLHTFEITPRGTAILSVFEPDECDLASVGGPRHAAVTNTAYQEIDITTGLVRREWTALDHVALSDSYSTATGSSEEWPFDYFHINSVDPLANGRTLISARNTWSLYELNTQTGQVITRIGGKHSTYKLLSSSASTAYQHDATALSNGTVSVFDNGGVPKVHSQSRVLLLTLNPKTMTDSVLSQFLHSPSLSSGSQGNVQSLEDGDFFVGWGAEPYFSEYSSSGSLLFDAKMPKPFQSYRSYRFTWTGTPATPPSAAAVKSSNGAVTVYASWNGDNRTASWRLLAGSSPTTLAPVGGAARAGFETAVAAPSSAAYVAVQSLGASGEVLGTSPPIKT